MRAVGNPRGEITACTSPCFYLYCLQADLRYEAAEVDAQVKACGRESEQMSVGV